VSANVVVLYHSGFGHTAVLAQAVQRGAAAVPGVAVALVRTEDVEQHWPELDAADAIVFGAPTLMGSLSAGMKHFMERCVERYLGQRWDGKLAAGFTNSASLSGDKLNTLVDFVMFSAQMGMHWLSLGLLSGIDATHSKADSANRLGSWLGATAQSNVDQGPDLAPPDSDRRTAEHLGRRVAEAALRWKAGGVALGEKGDSPLFPQRQLRDGR
jgi:NAD(P)H dehydrogenase (quinone)